MSEYSGRRLKSGIVKAEQLKATGAKTVVTSCHNCVDGLNDVIKHYKLDIKVVQLVNLVAEAVIIEPKPEMKPEKPVVVKTDHTMSGFKILVTDDEPDFLTFLGMVLEDNGATVIKATNGDEAIALAAKEKPDLITLDISMPGRSGIETFEIMRKTEGIATIPVCIITGRPEMRKLIYERPVNPPEGYVEKPIDENGILINVRKILNITHQA